MEFLLKNREYLSYVFNNMNRSEPELEKDILNIFLAPFANLLLNKLNTLEKPLLLLVLEQTIT